MSKHWKSVLKKGWLYAEAFEGKDVTLTIKLAEEGSVSGGESGEKETVVLTFKERPLKLGLNITNCTAIERLLNEGDHTKWAGARITFYPARIRIRDKQTKQFVYVQAVRVRDKLPAQKQAAEAAEQAPEPEAPEEQSA